MLEFEAFYPDLGESGPVIASNDGGPEVKCMSESEGPDGAGSSHGGLGRTSKSWPTITKECFGMFMSIKNVHFIYGIPIY